MSILMNKLFRQRLKIVQCLVFCAICSSTYAGDKAKIEKNVLKKFNPQYKINTREPQNFVADVDYIVEPQKREIWLENILVEDSAGVLVGIRDNLKSWQEQEDYITNWNLESFNGHTIVSSEEKKKYLNSKILRYADKRLAGEVKAAEKGSALAAVGTAQKALRPNTNVDISPNFKLKFKARLLQGKAIMNVVNPYVDYTTTFSLSGKVNMNMNKEIKQIRAVASVDYNVNEGQYVANLDKVLTASVRARISSSQAINSTIFSDESNSTVQLMYSTPFNY